MCCEIEFLPGNEMKLMMMQPLLMGVYDIAYFYDVQNSEVQVE